MPNMKIYVDDTLPIGCVGAIRDKLLPIREMLCEQLKVDKSACQFAVLQVVAMDDLPRVNVELLILPKPERSQDLIRDVCRKLQTIVAETTGQHVAVRAAALDPVTYIALK